MQLASLLSSLGKVAWSQVGFVAPVIILVVSVSWLPSLIFHLSQSLPDEIWDQNWDLISYCCDVSGLLAFSSPTPRSFAKVGWNGWTFPHFPEWMSVFFSFFFSVFVPGPTLALFPDCIVWFPCTVCGMNSKAKPESFAVQARVVACCWVWCLISLAHERSDSSKGRILLESWMN